MPNPFAKIPPRVRYWLYVVYSVVALVFGALQIAGVKHVGPVVVGTVMQELAFLGLALGFTAASNVSAIPDEAVQSYSDPSGPTGVAAGPAADVPTGAPVQPPLAVDLGPGEPRRILGKA